MDNLAIIKRIEMRLSEINMTKAEFYERSGISSASLSQWRTGLYNPTRKKLESAATCLGVSYEYLAFGSEETEKPPVGDERFLPLAERREALSKAGIHILLDADAKVTEEQLDDIISFIEIQQRRNGR